MVKINVNYSQGESQFKGYLLKPKNQKASIPGVVILHARMGLTEHEEQSAEKLVALGYMVLAADLYGENSRPKTVEHAISLTSYLKTNRVIYQERIIKAIDQLTEAGADPERIAVIGYCFGGIGALEAARVNLPVRGVVSFHGGLDKAKYTTLNVIKPKVLVLHGADDPIVSKAQVEIFQEEMRDSKADWQFIYYADTVHSFTIPSVGTDKSKGSAFHETSASRSWEHMKMFLKEVLGE